MQAAASKGASSQIQSVCASSFIPDWSRGTNLEDTVSTILLFGKDFESFFLIARSHHTIRYLQMTEFSFHRRRMKGGLSLKAPPAISREALKTQLSWGLHVSYNSKSTVTGRV